MSKVVLPFLAVLIAAFVAAAPGSGGTPAPGGPPPGAPIKADLNGNKIFDDLETRLAGAPADARVPVIIRLLDPATLSRVDGLMKAVGAFDLWRRFSVIQGFAATVTKGQVEALAHVPLVTSVEEDSPVHALNDQPQASFGVTKARLDMPSLDGNCDDAANPVCSPGTYGPADLVAAVIDTGIDTNHLDLNQGKVIGWKDFVNGKTSPYDDNGHGTHVSATIAGDGEARPDRLYKGAAPGAALVGVKVLNAQGSGTMSNVTAAIDWVVQNKATYGIEAINLSLGASGCSDGTDATSVAVNNAAANGIAVFVAAGNEGPGTCTVGSPGAARDAITVGAMADLSQGGFNEASFTSRGPTLDGRIKPDLSAPGVNVTSAQAGTTNGYVKYSGTSMATPFTAGVGLLMLDANPTLTPAQIKGDMMSTAIDWGRGGNNKTAGTTGQDIDYGAGRLDAYAAIAAAGAPLTSPPAVPTHTFQSGTLSGTGAVIDYKINVTDTSFPIAATMIIPSIAGASALKPDFDLYLYSPSGAQVASAFTTDRQEEIGYKPAVSGTYTLRVQSYSGSGDYFVDVSAGTTPPKPDFTISASPSSASTIQGDVAGASYTVSVGALNGYAGAVNLSVGGLPAGATATFTPTSVAGSGTSQLKVATSASTPTGSYSLTITGTDSTGAPTHATSATLVVNPPPQPDFGVSVSPSSTAVVPGGSSVYTVTVAPSNGFTGDVALSVSGQPASSTVTWSPSSTVAGGNGSSTLTIGTPAAAAAGTYTLTISGASGALSHSTTASLVVGPTSVTTTPASVTLLTGTLTGGNAASLAAADTNYLTVSARLASNFTTAWYGSFSGVPSTLTTIAVTYQGKNSLSCTQTIALWNFSTASWTQIDSRTVGSETKVTINVSQSLASYVSGGELRTRVRCKTAGGSFVSSGNLLQLAYTP